MSSLSEKQRDQIRSELNARGKIAAVKLYKTWMKCSLKEAKNAVEAIERGAEVAQPQRPDSAAEEQTMREIDKAIAQGNKLEAVKLYKQLSGKSLFESKDFVESRMSRPESQAGPKAIQSKRSGCLSVMLLFASMAGSMAVVGLVGFIIFE